MWESFNWYKRKNYKIHIFKKKIEDLDLFLFRRKKIVPSSTRKWVGFLTTRVKP